MAVPDPRPRAGTCVNTSDRWVSPRDLHRYRAETVLAPVFERDGHSETATGVVGSEPDASRHRNDQFETRDDERDQARRGNLHREPPRLMGVGKRDAKNE
jgi:hypothetical protein